MKNITIAGGVGRDAVIRTTQQGDKVAGFSVAVDEGRGQDKTTIWFDVSIWGKRAEALAQYLTKGSRVTISGDLGTREHEGRTYLTVRADQITLMGGGKRDDSEPRSNQGSGYGAGGRPSNNAGSRPDFDDEIPFCPEWRV